MGSQRVGHDWATFIHFIDFHRMISLTFTKLHNQPLVANSTQFDNWIWIWHQLSNVQLQSEVPVHSIIDRKKSFFSWKYMEDLNNLINQIDQIDIFEAFHSHQRILILSKVTQNIIIRSYSGWQTNLKKFVRVKLNIVCLLKTV